MVAMVLFLKSLVVFAEYGVCFTFCSSFKYRCVNRKQTKLSKLKGVKTKKGASPGNTAASPFEKHRVFQPAYSN